MSDQSSTPLTQAERSGNVDGRSTSVMQTGLSQLRGNVMQIKTAPRELWIIYSLKFYSSYSYFALSLTLTLFLSESFGLSDTEAGWAYGTFGMLTTVSGFFCGWVIDLLGVRLSLIIGSVLGVISRLMLAFTSSKTLALGILFSILPFSESMGIPIMTIGVKRYTNQTNRTFGFALFYSVMNIAAFFAGPAVDLCRGLFKNGLSIHLPWQEQAYLASALRVVVISSALSSVCQVFIATSAVREVELNPDGNVTTFTPNRGSTPAQSTLALLRDRDFWRLLLLTLLLCGVRMVFSHMSATLPKYLIRQFGEDAPFGLIYSINPFLIIILVPLVGLVSKDVASFPMILYGSILAAASPLLICIKQTYLFVVLFMVTLSLGEAVYSPRNYEFSMQLSARGAEGIYSSLAHAPLFTTQLLAGGLSGTLLSNFMPAEGPKHGRVVWAVIGATSLTSPLLMYIFRNFLGTDKPGNTGIESGIDRT